MNVCIIVLNYNNFDDTLECLESLSGLRYRSKKIVLVDNGSDKEVFRQLQEEVSRKFPEVEILRLEKNLGYAGGNNEAIREYCNFKYIFLVNNDLQLDSDALDLMVDEMEKDEKIAACQPVIYYYGSDRIWSCGTRIFLGYPRLYMKGKRAEIKESFEPPFGLVGCAMLIRISALRDVGFFDENLFLMHEETDWCIRAKKKGYRLLVTRARAYHKVSRTIGLFSRTYLYYTARNWLIVARKHGMKMFLYAVITEPLRIFYYLIKARRNVIFYIKGLLDALRGVRGESNIRCS